MDKLFDAILANIIMWSTLVCIVLLPKPDVNEIELKLTTMECVISQLDMDLQNTEVNITTSRFGDELPKELEWSFLFVKINSKQDELQFRAIRG